MDVVELALYSDVLSRVSLDGTALCYVNPRCSLEPLTWGGNLHAVGETGIFFRYWDD